MSNNVTIIGGSAFYNCSKLKSITIPKSVTFIGGGAFYNCGSLTKIIIPSSVTEISNQAFFGCEAEFYINSQKIKQLLINAGVDKNKIIIS